MFGSYLLEKENLEFCLGECHLIQKVILWITFSGKLILFDNFSKSQIFINNYCSQQQFHKQDIFNDVAGQKRVVGDVTKQNTSLILSSTTWLVTNSRKKKEQDILRRIFTRILSSLHFMHPAFWNRRYILVTLSKKNTWNKPFPCLTQKEGNQFFNSTCLSLSYFVYNSLNHMNCHPCIKWISIYPCIYGRRSLAVLRFVDIIRFLLFLFTPYSTSVWPINKLQCILQTRDFWKVR